LNDKSDVVRIIWLGGKRSPCRREKEQRRYTKRQVSREYTAPVR